MTDQNRVGEAIAAKEETPSQNLLRPAEPPEEHRDADTSPAPAATADDAASQADTPAEEQTTTKEQMPESLTLEQEPQAPSDALNATDESQQTEEEPAEVPQEESTDTASTAEAEPVASAEEAAPDTDAVVSTAETESAETETEEADTTAVPEAVVSETAETVSDQETETEAAGASFTPVEEDEDVRPRRLKDLEVGMELEGRITSIALYGVFVDIGVGRDGLVHISEMSDTRINSPSDLVQIGDTVNVRIKGLDLDARRISLTMRSPREVEGEQETRRGRARPTIDLDKIATMNVGDIVDGTVTGLSSFGAFVDIGVGKDGLVHISELSEGRIEKPEDAVQSGETHSFKILEIDPEGSRISLSLRRAQRVQKMRELEPGQQLDGTVSGLATFGAFVDIGVGRDGLVHISQISEERVEKVEDVIKVGDPVSVRVLEVDPQSKRISLTMRPEMPEQPEEELLENSVPEEASSAMAFERAAPQARDSGGQEESGERDRKGQGQGRKRGARQSRAASPQQSSGEIYTTEDEDDESFSGNATLEDLMNKFGGGGHRKDKDRRRRSDEEDEEDEDHTQRQRQRDVIRRTLRRDDSESEA
jgi:transcriptional accessory protein Tex/SPT6